MGVGEDVDSKFEEAVSTDMGGGDEEMDDFIQETFEDVEDEGGVADYDEDLGMDMTDGEGEEPVEDDEGADGGEEDTDEPDEDDEKGEDTDESPDEDDEGTDESEGEEAEEEDEIEGEEEEEGPFYDGERDFGESAVPTKYEDRMSANHGLVAKVSYFHDLQERLDEVGTDLGALSLPDAVGGDPQNFKQFADIEQVLSMPDDEAKEMIHQMDSLLRNMKNKAERHEKLQEEKQKKEEVTEEYAKAQQQAQVALKTLDIAKEVEPGMTNQEIIDMAYDKLESFESNEENLDEMSQKEFVGKLREMEDAVFALEDFAKVAVEHEQMKQEDTKEEVTPEQIENAFKEFMADQPDLDMVKNDRVEMQKSLIQTAIRKGWDVATPRDWLNNYQKFMKIVNANRTKKGLKKLKDKTKGDGEDEEKKKEKGKKSGRAQKYADKKPSKSPHSVSYSNRTDKKDVDKIDDEIDKIAAELTEGTALDEGW